MTDWPIVQPGAGPDPFIHRDLDEEPFITEPKQVVAFGLVDGFPWSLVSFQIETRPHRGHPFPGGRMLELFLSHRDKPWPMGGSGSPASIPPDHAISLSAQFTGRAPTLSAHSGVASDEVQAIRVVLENGEEREIELLETRPGWPRAFVAFPPADMPGQIKAFDDLGKELDAWPLFVRPPAPRMSSEELFERASLVIPGGVNSPVRAFGGVGGTPRFVVRGKGAYLETADGDRLVDYVMSWGALLFGHARAEIVEAAAKAAERGTSFGVPTEAEVELAEEVADLVPSVEKVRLVSSGTEATMSAVRLARGATGRAKVLKFAGHYHGHSDGLLAEAGSGVATFGIPGSAGVTPGATQDTIVLSWNDPGDVAAAFAAAGGDLAAVILEPVPANMGVVPAAEGFVEELRRLCDEGGALLIFDEVITGFRLDSGGAQQRFGITPDLTTLGKVLGGGFPLAAFGGRADVMDRLAPVGDVYQAGTLSGNPVAVAAGLAALRLIGDEPPYGRLDDSAERLADGLADALSAVPHTINRVGSLFSVFFGPAPVTDYASAKAADHAAYGRFFHAMLERGIYLPPSGYEGWFLSAAHGDEELERTIDAARHAARVVESGPTSRS